MSSARNKDDIVRYGVRLNLNNPVHLRVHEILSDLNKEVHISQNNFIIESIIRNANTYSDEELIRADARELDDSKRYVTQNDFNDMALELKENLMKEMLSIVCTALAKGSIATQMVSPKNEDSNAKKQIESENFEDETMMELSKGWS